MVDSSHSVNPVPWDLKLFVVGKRGRHWTAYRLLKSVLDSCVAGQYAIEVVDLAEQPDLAEKYNIIAAPMLVRRNPPPEKKLIGDFSQGDVLRAALELPPPAEETIGIN